MAQCKLLRFNTVGSKIIRSKLRACVSVFAMVREYSPERRWYGVAYMAGGGLLQYKYKL